ncbi:uncharacterized protein ASPGLDRAFT_47248 [Aspergillus glaucus CBS 516.65]|uniref:Uncharacterized protein n=1 Tax=Aspergillus glaucus CBS 516.65 TaxID=1160497 RepID=A0A1L9VKE7_ASPGL|nr:hypothetical protein ASPGLDRAFT_47248 [Aspergillus glaucus CBS 516.65]OJJ84362.1 hypothetical protein ASPGLDRAFT_47248 [Aspergillus glaucus CBS 516.65]
MNSAQAKEWKSAGTVVPGKKIGQRQLGEGQYTTPGIGQWPGPMDRQFCAISANANAWNQAEKAWIPAADTSGNKLWENPINMDMYIKKLGFKDPEKVARMSVIKGMEDTLQMVIPDAFTKKGGGNLDLKFECHPNVEDFNGNTPEVDYYSWKGVKGEPIHPNTDC